MMVTDQRGDRGTIGRGCLFLQLSFSNTKLMSLDKYASTHLHDQRLEHRDTYIPRRIGS